MLGEAEAWAEMWRVEATAVEVEEIGEAWGEKAAADAGARLRELAAGVDAKNARAGVDAKAIGEA